MPSYKKNRCIVVSPQKGKSGTTFILIQKTGYANIWVGDRHYYWDYTEQIPNQVVDFNAITDDYIARQQSKKKITVRRR